MKYETQFQIIEELMEYVNREAERRAGEILKKRHQSRPCQRLSAGVVEGERPLYARAPGETRD